MFKKLYNRKRYNFFINIMQDKECSLNIIHNKTSSTSGVRIDSSVTKQNLQLSQFTAKDTAECANALPWIRIFLFQIWI